VVKVCQILACRAPGTTIRKNSKKKKNPANRSLVGVEEALNKLMEKSKIGGRRGETGRGGKCAGALTGFKGNTWAMEKSGRVV